MAAPNLRNPVTVTGKTIGYDVPSGIAAALVNASGSNAVLKVNSVYAANVASSGVSYISLSHYNGTTDFYLANQILVPAEATQILVSRDAYIYLEEGYSLRANCNTPSGITLVIGYEDIS